MFVVTPNDENAKQDCNLEMYQCHVSSYDVYFTCGYVAPSSVLI